MRGVEITKSKPVVCSHYSDPPMDLGSLGARSPSPSRSVQSGYTDNLAAEAVVDMSRSLETQCRSSLIATQDASRNLERVVRALGDALNHMNDYNSTFDSVKSRLQLRPHR